MKIVSTWNALRSNSTQNLLGDVFVLRSKVNLQAAKLVMVIQFTLTNICFGPQRKNLQLVETKSVCRRQFPWKDVPSVRDEKPDFNLPGCGFSDLDRVKCCRWKSMRNFELRSCECNCHSKAEHRGGSVRWLLRVRLRILSRATAHARREVDCWHAGFDDRETNRIFIDVALETFGRKLEVTYAGKNVLQKLLCFR